MNKKLSISVELSSTQSWKATRSFILHSNIIEKL